MTYTGYLQVEVGNKRNKSVITNSFFDGILKITRPTYLSGELPLLTLIHVGGGYVDGDTYKTEIVVHESSRIALTTQASTKVYKSPRFGVTQTMDYVLKDNSQMYIKQDPLILYKDANFKQYTNVHMSSSAIFYYTDIITPGWSEDGKLFQYEKITSKMKIFVDGVLEVFDHLQLQPDEYLEKIMGLEGYSHIGTMFFIHEKVNEAFLEQLRKELASYSDSIRVGVSLLSIKGMSVRMLARNTTVIESMLSKCEEVISEHLDQDAMVEWRKG